jgi:hypothetical protein
MLGWSCSQLEQSDNYVLSWCSDGRRGKLHFTPHSSIRNIGKRSQLGTSNYRRARCEVSITPRISAAFHPLRIREPPQCSEDTVSISGPPSVHSIPPHRVKRLSAAMLGSCQIKGGAGSDEPPGCEKNMEPRGFDIHACIRNTWLPPSRSWSSRTTKSAALRTWTKRCPRPPRQARFAGWHLMNWPRAFDASYDNPVDDYARPIVPHKYIEICAFFIELFLRAHFSRGESREKWICMITHRLLMQ